MLLQVYQQQKEDLGHYGPAAGWSGDLIATNIAKIEVRSEFFTSVFTGVRFAIGKSVRTLRPVGKT